MIVEAATAYVEPGFTARDKYDGDLIDKVKQNVTVGKDWVMSEMWSFLH